MDFDEFLNKKTSFTGMRRKQEEPEEDDDAFFIIHHHIHSCHCCDDTIKETMPVASMTKAEKIFGGFLLFLTVTVIVAIAAVSYTENK